MNEKIDGTTSILSKSVKFDDMTSSSQTHYNNSNNLVEELTPEVFLPTTSSFNPGKLLINQDIDEDNSQRICTIDVDFDNMKQKTTLAITQNNSKFHQHKKVRCHLFELLKLCWSWFCGLDDDYSELHPKIIENNDFIEKQESFLIHIKEHSIIKWLLNGNLIFILLVEITLFIIFTIPAKYIHF